MSVDEKVLREAEAARHAGNLALAVSLCEAFLVQHPAYPAAESLLGLCQIENGDQRGAAHIEAAALAAPNNPRILLNLSILRELQGEIRESVRAANQAATLAPGRFECWGQLGKVLGKAGKFTEATTALAKALELKPGHPGIALLLAGAAIEAGDLAAAERGLAILAAMEPAPSELLRIRTHYARKKLDWQGMAEAASRWRESDPQNDEAVTALAHAYSRLGYYASAAEAMAPLARKGAPEHVASFAKYLLGDRQAGKAAEAFQRVMAMDPDNSDAACGLARCSLFAGNLEEAAQWARKALTTTSPAVDAYNILNEATGGRLSDEELAGLAARLKDSSLSVDDRVTAHFAIGDAHHRREDRDAAFAAWQAANDVKRTQMQTSGRAYDRAGQEAFVARLKALFPGQPDSAGVEVRPGDPVPVFIVGMPRSGTTLLESALAAHSNIEGAGEVGAMPYILAEFLSWAGQTGWSGETLPGDKVAAWRKFYFDNCRRYASGPGQYITDKQPENFHSAGLIRILFPEAKIIHIRRSPIEVGFSIFRRNFSYHWACAVDLEDIAHFYAQHTDLINHWADVLGDDFGFVQYESLATDFDNELRRLLDFCDLPFEEACLRFFESDRAVFTFSASQVRQAPSSRHLHPSSPYAEKLAPLRAALEAAGIAPATGAFAER